MDLVEQLLGDRVGDARTALSNEGLSPSQAQDFLPPAVTSIAKALAGGEFDLSKLLSGEGVSELLGQIDLSALAKEGGVGDAQARGGLAALVPLVAKALEQNPTAKGLLDTFSAGGAAGLLGAAKKLFS